MGGGGGGSEGGLERFQGLRLHCGLLEVDGVWNFS